MCISETVKTRTSSPRGTSNQRIKQNCIQFNDEFEGERSKPHPVQQTSCSPRHVRSWAEAAGRYSSSWLTNVSSECGLFCFECWAFVSGCLFRSITTPSLLPASSVFWRVGGTLWLEMCGIVDRHQEGCLAVCDSRSQRSNLSTALIQ